MSRRGGGDCWGPREATRRAARCECEGDDPSRAMHRYRLAPALFAAGTGASGLSPALADAPKGLVPIALQAGQLTGIDGNVLLAVAKVECDYGRCRSGQPDDLVPADLRAHVEAAALQPAGA